MIVSWRRNNSNWLPQIPKAIFFVGESDADAQISEVTSGCCMKTSWCILQGLGVAAGIASAWFWWRSSQTNFEVRFVSQVSSGSPVPNARDIEAYLKKVGDLNKKAAAMAAISVILTTIAGIVGL